MTPDIEHTPDCAGPSIASFIGRLGDPMQRCRNCGRFRIADPPATTESTLRYRCRDHEHPVNWRGQGCPYCSAPPLTKAERRARRTARRMENYL